MRRPSRTSSSTRPAAAGAAASRPSVTRRRSARAATVRAAVEGHGSVDRLDAPPRADVRADVRGDRDGAGHGLERTVEVEPGRRDRGPIARSDGRREPRHALDRLSAARDPAGRRDVEHAGPDDPFRAGRPPEDEPIARRDRDRAGQAEDRDGDPVGQVERVPTAPADARLDRRRPGCRRDPRPIGQGACAARRGSDRWPRPLDRRSGRIRDGGRPGRRRRG